MMNPDTERTGSTRDTKPEVELARLRTLVGTLRQLIDQQDAAALTQAGRLAQTLAELQQSTESLLRSEQLLAEHKHILQSILASMSDGVVVAGGDGRFLEFNPAAERILGVGRLDISPAQWTEKYQLYLPDRETPYPAEDLPLARAMQGEAVDEVEIYIRRSPTDGTWLNVNARPLQDGSGVVQGGVAVFRDVTAHRESQDLVQRLSAAVEQTADTVFITDLSGRILYINPAFENTTGYGREEVLGKTPRILKSGQHEPEYYRSLWKTILAGEVFRGTTINQKKNGEFYHAEQTITPLKDRSGRFTHFVAVVKDMTERRRIQAQEIEMRVASVVQKKLYPQRGPLVRGFEVAGAVLPAKATCGDYFDYLPMTRDAMGIAIGDVSGHGFGPALLMAETRAYLRSLTHEWRNLGRIFAWINDVLVDDLEDEHFVTLMVVQLDTERRCLRYCNAGHIPGYLLGSDGAVKAVLASNGPPLGMYPDREYGCSEETITEPGDLLVLLTDGITESQDSSERFFGVEGALDVIRAHQGEPTEQLLHHVFRAARDFAGPQPQEDDMTIVLCRRTT
jgi:PAS domain S-box-containing protein